MKSAMEIDRAKHTILPLSKFGLMQITRQRVRPAMTVTTTETCPVCHGSGKAEAAILVIDKIEDKLEYLIREKKYKCLRLKCILSWQPIWKKVFGLCVGNGNLNILHQ